MTVQELIDALLKANAEQRCQRIGYRTSGRFLGIDWVMFDQHGTTWDDAEIVTILE